MSKLDGVDVQKLRSTLGAAARQARRRARLTQSDVADRVGLVTEVYGRLERGHLLPSVPSLLKLCLALKVSSDSLLGLDASRLPRWVELPGHTDTPQLRRLFRALRLLSPAQLKAVAQVVHVIQKSRGPPEVP
jgi:transcriptional regulator with XRE-family HTH domain